MLLKCDHLRRDNIVLLIGLFLQFDQFVDLHLLVITDLLSRPWSVGPRALFNKLRELTTSGYFFLNFERSIYPKLLKDLLVVTQVIYGDSISYRSDNVATSLFCFFGFASTQVNDGIVHNRFQFFRGERMKDLLLALWDSHDTRKKHVKLGKIIVVVILMKQLQCFLLITN